MQSKPQHRHIAVPMTIIFIAFGMMFSFYQNLQAQEVSFVIEEADITPTVRTEDNPFITPTIDVDNPSITASTPTSETIKLISHQTYLPLIFHTDTTTNIIEFPSPDIVGGTTATKNEFPWQARITLSGSHRCGGSLIHPELVLTAAHCLANVDISKIKVILGDHYISSSDGTEQIRSVAQFIMYPYYSSVNSDDIALIRLATPVNISTGVGTIRLTPSGDPDGYTKNNNNVVASGWGITIDSGNVSDVLRKVTLTLGNCKINTNGQYICSPTTGKDTCQGDSGGPLVYYDNSQPILVGITSHGEGCNGNGYYTNVAYYAPWIQSHIFGLDGIQVVATVSDKCLEISGGIYAVSNGANAQQYDCLGSKRANQIWRLIPDGSAYKIVVLHSNKCLDVAGGTGATNDGANVQQYNCLGSSQTNQRWRLFAKGDGFEIRAVHSNKCLDVAGGSTGNNVNVQQYVCNGTASQRWRIQPTGTTQLIAQNSGKCLDVDGGNGARANGYNVHQWQCIGPQQANQIWRLVRVGDAYQVIASHSGKCLDVSGWSTSNGGNVQQWACGTPSQANQLWRLVPINGSTGFQLVSKHSGKCLDVAGGGTDNNVNIQQWECNATTAQRWNLNWLGATQLRASHSNKCLDVDRGRSEDNTNVQQWTCLGITQENQLWRFVPMGDTYQVVATHSGKCLDVYGESKINGGNVHQYQCVGASQKNQLWRLQPDGAGYRLIASHSQLCLDVAGGTTNDGVNVQQYVCNGTAAQRWRMIRP